MTGFASHKVNHENFAINCEIRSINNRFLELQVKMPEEWRFLESEIRDIVREKIPRGKVEVKIAVDKERDADGKSIKLDEDLVKELVKLNKKITKKYEDIVPLSFKDILTYPGVQISEAPDREKMAKVIKKVVKTAVRKLEEVKENEGRRLEENLIEKLKTIDFISAELLKQSPDVQKRHAQKLKARIQDATGGIDEEKFAQELATIMQRYDVDEELVRLHSHVKESLATMNSKSPESKGKKLDFYMQEFLREANTLGSKSVCEDFSKASVELKVIIEQMREQVQNIE